MIITETQETALDGMDRYSYNMCSKKYCLKVIMIWNHLR